ncbi:hypothetical protein B7R21_06280 [Subtercola boreus]|uniref:Uncharacterized protein n=1 Tax=Subtercola boreus TaxID=120213 RepID=A0A3E0VYI8_9MICO|nr:hypothetical protein [Subtercola boreus]RFA14549.1 hypothetical protein B7R21_06280 [Subtercola boreus]
MTSRWVYLGKYLFFALFGVVAAIRGAPSLDLSTPDGYRPIWAVFIVIASLGCLYGCLRDNERLEWLSLLVMLPCLGAYVYAIAYAAAYGAREKQALAIIITLVLFLPTGRWFDLMPRLKVRK